MDQGTDVAFIMIALGLLACIMGWLYFRHRRSRVLQHRFGPEYDRVIQKEGNARREEGVLEFRKRKREALKISPIPSASQLEFTNRWNAVQARFVDDPEGSVASADSLISDVMEARGYPVANFEERAEVISVDHPDVVENYRTAHAIATSRSRGQVTTENLRKTMLHYRSLLEELLHDTLPERKEARA